MLDFLIATAVSSEGFPNAAFELHNPSLLVSFTPIDSVVHIPSVVLTQLDY